MSRHNCEHGCDLSPGHPGRCVSFSQPDGGAMFANMKPVPSPPEEREELLRGVPRVWPGKQDVTVRYAPMRATVSREAAESRLGEVMGALKVILKHGCGPGCSHEGCNAKETALFWSAFDKASALIAAWREGK